MNGIGWAVKAMRDGARVRREGWPGGAWLSLRHGYPRGVAIDEQTAVAFGMTAGDVCAFDPYVVARSAEGSFAPWACSQADLLAVDWEAAP